MYLFHPYLLFFTQYMNISIKVLGILSYILQNIFTHYKIILLISKYNVYGIIRMKPNTPHIPMALGSYIDLLINSPNSI
jgi:hypothetical protein